MSSFTKKGKAIRNYDFCVRAEQCWHVFLTLLRYRLLNRSRTATADRRSFVDARHHRPVLSVLLLRSQPLHPRLQLWIPWRQHRTRQHNLAFGQQLVEPFPLSNFTPLLKDPPDVRHVELALRVGVSECFGNVILVFQSLQEGEHGLRGPHFDTRVYRRRHCVLYFQFLSSCFSICSNCFLRSAS